MPTIFDTHCHYNLEPLFGSWKEHWQTARDAGVERAVVVGTDLESSRTAIELAVQEPRLLAAVGIHPTAISDHSMVVTVEWLMKELAALQKLGPVSAIGETGLDYYRLDVADAQLADKKQKQRDALDSHLTVARALKLPALLHVRDTGEEAYRDVLAIIEPFAKDLTIVLHCFSGLDWYLDKALSLGCYISFAGNLTYPSAKLLREHAARVPMDRLLAETDAPFLSPNSHRGQVCEPAFILETVATLQSVTGVTPEQLVTNATRIFTTI